MILSRGECCVSIVSQLKFMNHQHRKRRHRLTQTILTYLGMLLQGKSGSSTGLPSLSGTNDQCHQKLGLMQYQQTQQHLDCDLCLWHMAAMLYPIIWWFCECPAPSSSSSSSSSSSQWYYDGQMVSVFVLAEAITGRKVYQHLHESINFAALLFLLVVTFSIQNCNW